MALGTTSRTPWRSDGVGASALLADSLFSGLASLPTLLLFLLNCASTVQAAPSAGGSPAAFLGQRQLQAQQAALRADFAAVRRCPPLQDQAALNFAEPPRLVVRQDDKFACKQIVECDVMTSPPEVRVQAFFARFV